MVKKAGDAWLIAAIIRIKPLLMSTFFFL